MKSHHRLVSTLLLAVAAFTGVSPAQAQGRAGRDIPYATTFAITVAAGRNVVGQFSPDPVPADKRLVIEFVSIAAFAQGGERPSVFLNDLVGGAGRLYWIALTQPDPVGDPNVWRTGQLLKLYHDGNGVNGPGASCGRGLSSTTTTLTCSYTISGYLVDK